MATSTRMLPVWPPSPSSSMARSRLGSSSTPTPARRIAPASASAKVPPPLVIASPSIESVDMSSASVSRRGGRPRRLRNRCGCRAVTRRRGRTSTACSSPSEIAQPPRCRTRVAQPPLVRALGVPGDGRQRRLEVPVAEQVVRRQFGALAQHDRRVAELQPQRRCQIALARPAAPRRRRVPDRLRAAERADGDEVPSADELAPPLALLHPCPRIVQPGGERPHEQLADKARPDAPVGADDAVGQRPVRLVVGIEDEQRVAPEHVGLGAVIPQRVGVLPPADERMAPHQQVEEEHR